MKPNIKSKLILNDGTTIHGNLSHVTKQKMAVITYTKNKKYSVVMIPIGNISIAIGEEVYTNEEDEIEI
ncbi:hypothetical protein [Psychrobacillus sp.]|uniref:hypothetical protein n=1 Tax=Psychrobacillus sp. TaxID=1871623 RepID=UPI0028BDFE81|nr:hypothetical protein [Psychrobacillus sp.]